MAYREPPAALTAFFAALIARRPGLTPRKMFGYPAAFMNGKFAAGLYQDQLLLRLPPDHAAALVSLGAKTFEPIAGRKMTGFMVVPVALRTDAKLTPWLERAIAHAAAVAAAAPAKPRKKAAKKPKA